MPPLNKSIIIELECGAIQLGFTDGFLIVTGVIGMCLTA